MGGGIASSELIVRQYLLVRLGGINLNRALLLAAGKKNTKVVFPLPPEWRLVISLHGFEVAHFRSAVLWQFYVFMLLAYGVAREFQILLAGVGSSSRSRAVEKPYVYFADLGRGNLPHETPGRKSHDVISWYLHWEGRGQDIQAVHHSVANSVSKAENAVEIIYQRGPLPALADLNGFAKFLLWSVRAIAIAIIDMLRGRWWHALLLNQAAEAAHARILPPNLLAKEYFFHNSNWIYRPLWTYDAEQRGSIITFYFYSTNCESFKRLDGYPPMPYGWRAMNWPRYLVWDNYQADFVRRAVGDDVNIETVGDIWFQSSAGEIQTLPRMAVAVFDVAPVRESYYRTLGIDFTYYTPRTAISFLIDIQSVLAELNYVLALKRKREIGRRAHPAYRSTVATLNRAPNFVEVDSGIEAARLIEDCAAVISMPFTSTALLGRAAGKPSSYYDPHGLLQKDDRAAHGIVMLRGRDELRCWIAGISESFNAVAVGRA
jgi:polysaccharide biosynthesis PFTS motif protein